MENGHGTKTKMDKTDMEPKQKWIKRTWNLNKNGYSGHGT